MQTIYEQDIQTKMRKYYRVKEAAELFSVSEKTIRRWISDRFIKAVRIGGSVRIPISEMERVIQPANE
jgi:excisionase family DNA binding protein